VTTAWTIEASVQPAGGEDLAQGAGNEYLVPHAWCLWEDGPLDEPVIEAPPGVRSELRSWRMQAPANERRGEPARWVGQIALELADNEDDVAMPDDAVIVITLDADQSLRVPLRRAGD
jgi:hypothetical protein